MSKEDKLFSSWREHSRGSIEGAGMHTRGGGRLPLFIPHQFIGLSLSSSLSALTTHVSRCGGRRARKVGKILPVVVGVSDSWTTRDCCRLIASAFYQWRARVTVFHVYVRTPRDYAQRRTRDIVRRRGTDVRFPERRTWIPVTRRVSRRRTVSCLLEGSLWNKPRLH